MIKSAFFVFKMSIRLKMKFLQGRKAKFNRCLQASLYILKYGLQPQAWLSLMTELPFIFSLQDKIDLFFKLIHHWLYILV